MTDGGAEPIGAKQTISSIAPGESATTFVSYDTTGKSGERRIRVVADPHQIIPERAENDNEAVALLRIANAPLPNVAITPENIGFSRVVAQPGEPVTVTVTASIAIVRATMSLFTFTTSISIRMRGTSGRQTCGRQATSKPT